MQLEVECLVDLWVEIDWLLVAPNLWVNNWHDRNGHTSDGEL